MPDFAGVGKSRAPAAMDGSGRKLQFASPAIRYNQTYFA
jgi:hypothetical protein